MAFNFAPGGNAYDHSANSYEHGNVAPVRIGNRGEIVQGRTDTDTRIPLRALGTLQMNFAALSHNFRSDNETGIYRPQERAELVHEWTRGNRERRAERRARENAEREEREKDEQARRIEARAIVQAFDELPTADVFSWELGTDPWYPDDYDHGVLTCIVCMDGRVNIALQCGHCFCADCVEQLQAYEPICPKCRADITSSIRIFL